MSNERETDKATPRPWVVEHDGESDERTYFPVITFEARNIAVVEAYYGDGAANAALIVRAVNAHEALVTACEADVRLMGNLLEDLERIAGPAVIRGIMDRMRHTRAALALARGN